MSTDRPARNRLRRGIAVGLTVLGGAMLVLALMLLGTVAALKAGAGAGPVRSLLQAKLGRPVSFAHLAVQQAPDGLRLTFTDLRVGQPAKFGPGELLHAPRLAAVVRIAPLIAGRLEVPVLELSSPELHLRRRGPGDNNYSFGKGGGGASVLGATRTLSIADGRLDMSDPQRSLTLQGAFSHDSRAADLPLSLEGGGVLKGEAYSVQARGGPLNGRRPHTPHRVDVDLRDGLARVRLTGTTQAPFDFRGLDMDVDAQGPNLADLAYLFGLLAPNSPPFRLSGHMHREDKRFTLTRLHARLGDSDLEGEIDAQHLGRRRIEARLRAARVTSRDLRVLLASPPSHAVARAQPGVAGRGGGTASKTRLLSTTPVSLGRLKGSDSVLRLHADRADGFGAAVSDADLNLSVTDGRLAIAPLSFRMADGEVRMDYGLDTRPARPAARLTARVRGVQMGRVAGASRFSGRLDADVEARGSGDSVAAQAATSDGRATVRVTGGALPSRAAAALNGDVLGLIGASLSPGGKAPLRCVAADFDVRSGVATATRLTVATDAGRATGGGRIDLRDERLELSLQASSRGGGPPVQLRIPIVIGGVLLRPVVTGRAPSPGSGVGDLLHSIGRAVGVGSSPAPPPAC